jgi:hypothetical protein
VRFQWVKPCSFLIRFIEPRLRQGRRFGLRRDLLATVLKVAKKHFVRFYTVQSPNDVLRLKRDGEPWPNEPLRSQFGPGVYAWRCRLDARSYRSIKSRRTPDLEIVKFVVLARFLKSLDFVDVDRLPDREDWMDNHSRLSDNPEKWSKPRADYIMRPTGVEHGEVKAVEHYLSATIFHNLCFY